MDRNLWLAVALSAGVYLIWYGYFDKKVNPPHAVSAPYAQNAVASVARAPGASSSPASAGTGAALQDPKVVLAQSDEIMLGDATALVSPRGAALASYSFQGPIARVELVDNSAEGLFATFPDLTFKRDASAKTAIVYVATRPDGIRINGSE